MRARRGAILATVLATFLLVIPASAVPEHTEVIVVLQPGDRPVADVANEVASAHSGQVGFVYTTALQGFTLTLPEAAVAGLSQNPNIAYVEPVQEVKAVGTQPIPEGIDRIEGDLNPPTVPMDTVELAILDTGIYIGTNPNGSSRSHLDLNLRYVSDCTGAFFYPTFGGCSGSGDFQDRHGHGTHVAGIAGAKDNDIGSVGVAPGVTLWSFKVLQDDGTGTTGMILAGIDAVTSQADRIDVANMSLGFVGWSQAMDDALANAKAAGVTFVVAAGNDAIDASQFFPAASQHVVTVSAIADFDGLPGGLGAATCRSDIDDTLADFSNFGPYVEIAAPGVCIFSTDLNDGYSEKSGTSMASPFVAGAIARYIAETGAPTNNATNVDSIVNAVLGSAFPQASACGFTDVDSSPEPLLSVNGAAYDGDGSCGTGEPPANNPPTADYTYECTGLDCVFTDASSDTDGTIVSWNWDLGDGNTSTAQNPTHTYAADNTYTVTLTTTDDDGDTGNVSYDVTVAATPPPNNAPTADYTYECTGLDCVFTDASSDTDGTIVSWNWDLGDGNTSTAQNPTHTYAADNTYTVTLTTTDDDGDTGNVSYDVTVFNSPPEAGFSSNCTDLECTFTNTSTDADSDALTYLWDFGDGNTSTAENPVHTYASGGSYTVSLTADDGLATDTANGSVSPTDPPPPPASALAASVAPFSLDGRDAQVSMTIYDATTIALVGGATVEGTWTYLDRRGRTKTATSSTVSSSDWDMSLDQIGNASITKRFPRGATVTQFCLTSVTAPGYEDAPLADPCVGSAGVSASALAIRFETPE